MSYTTVHLGMDDIDSPRGGCTTHFASILAERLEEFHVQWLDYPNLIRLNPNIPFRTRGNGAVALRFIVRSEMVAQILSMTRNIATNYVERGYPNTNPGLVVVTGDPPDELIALARRTLWRTVPIALAQRIIQKHSLKHFSMGNGRGLVGSLSAIGNQLMDDHTYEYLAYRSVDACSQERGVDAESVFDMDKMMGDRLFSNIDPMTGEVLIAPRGPDPVIYGIRGERPYYVVEAAELVRSVQAKDRWMIMRTNQGTGEHLTHHVSVCDLRPYMAAVVQGRVASPPRMIEGGHVIFSVADETGTIDCAIYEPAGELRENTLMLAVNDEVALHSGVRPAASSHGLTLNVEGFEVLEVSETVVFSNPVCPQCGRRMTSAGQGKGFKCTACGFKGRDSTKTGTSVTRGLERGLYLPPPRAQRHLTRPKTRMNKRNSGAPTRLIHEWHYP